MISLSQTVIEMKYIEDADVVLTEVDCIDSADVVIYKTTNKNCAKHWDCMWLFKNWGFSNFSVYIIKPGEPISIADSCSVIPPISGKVYFSDDFKVRGYKTDTFHLDGVMRIKRLD